MKIPFFKRKDDESKNENEEGRVGRFASGIADFFDPEPEKEKILRHEDFRGAGDEYYATVSSRYKIAQRIFTLLCVIFLLFSILTNVSDITYENLFYFVREFGAAVDLASVEYETLSYDVYNDQSFTLYRGGIAAVSPSGVSIYTATGRRTLRSRTTCVSPCSVASKKYLLTYDTQGNSFSLYNSFSKVYTESFDYPISDAAISESGVFAVVTRSPEYKTVVNVYDGKIRLSGRYSEEMYSFDVAIDESGERMSVLFYDKADGRGATILRVYDISKHDKEYDNNLRVLFEETYFGVFPLGCSFFDNGRLALVTDGSVSVFDEEYKVLSTEGYTEEISAFCATPEGVAVALRSGALNDVNRVIAFDSEGERIYSSSVKSSAEGIGVFGKYLFLKSTRGVLRLDTDKGETESFDCQNGKLMVYDDKTAIICGESSAVYVKFGNG